MLEILCIETRGILPYKVASSKDADKQSDLHL